MSAANGSAIKPRRGGAHPGNHSTLIRKLADTFYVGNKTLLFLMHYNHICASLWVSNGHRVVGQELNRRLYSLENVLLLTFFLWEPLSVQTQ